MLFKEAIERIEGLKFISESLELLSGTGRKALMNTSFYTDTQRLAEIYRHIALAIKTIRTQEYHRQTQNLYLRLMNVRDIYGTLLRLSAGEVLDDVDFFEIKGLVLTATELRNIVASLPISVIKEISIPDLGELRSILDPEKSCSTSFHIYDSYSEELSLARKELKQLQQTPGFDEGLSEKLTARCISLEDEVRRDLSSRLTHFSGILTETLEKISQLDLLIAKARLSYELELYSPAFNRERNTYKNLRYPPVETRLAGEGRNFQPVDITLERGVTLITGANMGGKTITLKSLALAQAMAQFGFFVAATEACILPVEDILASLSDSQSEELGLSSFGSEILNLDNIINRAYSPENGERYAILPTYLILIDEPARTTNPEEGSAFVNALTDMLGQTESISVVTTHYSGIKDTGSRLKVKGLKDAICSASQLKLNRLQDYMDYSLIKDEEGEVPHEALKIAELLGISEMFADKVKKYL